MDCRILRQITLKSNGYLACDDSVGYGIDLGRVELAEDWRLTDVLNGPRYRHVRTAFSQGRVPWPGTCDGCDLLSDGASPEDRLDRKIDLLIEPTLDCSLSCACCLRKQIIRKGRSVDPLDPNILDKLIRSCTREGIEIGEVHYIGWGEPLLHPMFSTLFEIVDKHAPQATQMVTTAANVDFRTTVGDKAMDKIIVSIDGAKAESYSAYRRNGNFEQAINFMRDCKAYGDRKIFLEWKYILFEHNHSDEEIIRAQEMADEIGVDSLLFILTNSKWKSNRYSSDSLDLFPLKFGRAAVSSAAAMNTVAATCSLEVMSAAHDNPQEQAKGHIDRCWVSEGNFLWVEGWALDEHDLPPVRIDLLVDGSQRATSAPTMRRDDVLAVHQTAADPTCGFLFRIPRGNDALPDRVEILVHNGCGHNWLGGTCVWETGGGKMKKRKDLV